MSVLTCNMCLTGSPTVCACAVLLLGVDQKLNGVFTCMSNILIVAALTPPPEQLLVDYKWSCTSDWLRQQEADCNLLEGLNPMSHE